MKEIFVITYKTENNYKCGRMWPNENKIMTVSGRNSDAIIAGYRHYPEHMASLFSEK
ncbi:hypothetical protein NXX54_17580 [Bacteroides sp. BFG-638]|uniref:Uncharacterized protein n=1 Tax=Bacteroides vicugnae TaxID=3037989 RepID=A0ABU5HKS8_9BACE|nr:MULTISPECIES: hypothetical protein [Bacteroides]MCS2583077.1 hypothetical protein [Bacteroides sp. BFG-551]MBV3833482.1 hypothetical protein [Bacteroides xylanisolvens]MBV3876681.1 hypothetical protein [Bacteroides xylanisolvens]MBV3881782.1 hypothetical protein [Bacteroides xylanisolvens]MBV3908003.1 hypothetical protein [Bacteroides xylanisolvens]